MMAPTASSSGAASGSHEPLLVPPPSIAAPGAPTPRVQPDSSPASKERRQQRAGLSRREIVMIGGALAMGGVVTFAVFGSRGGPSPVAAAANRAPVKPAAVASPPALAPTQTWSIARRAYWTANQRHSDAFELPAENTVAIWLNYVRPLLVVRCMNKRTEAFIYTGSALKIEPNTEDHTVSFHFDGDAGQSERWPDSAEHDALFAPDGSAFAHRLLAAKTLRFGYTPHNAEPVEAQFHVDGLAELLAPAAKDCGWDK
jgi:hypothetical protein